MNEKRTYETHGAYFGDPAVKALHVAQAKHHAEADMLVAGTYCDLEAREFRGCSVGCFAHEIDPSAEYGFHTTVATDRGLPEWLVHWQDVVFEGLPAGERADFHIALAESIPEGADLTTAMHEAAVARMDRCIARVDAASWPHVISAINTVRELHAAQEPAESSAWSEAQSAAGSAAFSEMGSAWSAAESAAWSAFSEVGSARSAARSAAQSAAGSAAEYISERDAMLQALRALDKGDRS